MEDWHDWVSLLGYSVFIATVAALVLGSAAYVVVRSTRLLPRFRNRHTWRGDLRQIRWLGGITFLFALLGSSFLSVLFSRGCGSSDSFEFPSPDNKHKIVAYTFDCGATTDSSLIVSLLQARENLPKYRTAPVIYSRYHDQALAGGIKVDWATMNRVIVQIANFERPPIFKRQDGVEVTVRRMQ